MTLPPELAGFLGMLGVPWPNIDEDEIRKDAAAWRIVQAGAAATAGDADQTVHRTWQTYHGESATELAGHWSTVGGEGGHLAQATLASRTAPVALDGTAGVVSAVKLAVGTQAAAGLASVTQALVLGGAVGVTAATARMYLTRHAMGKALREGAEGTGKVLAPALGRRVTDPMRRILDNLRRPGAPGTPALAGVPRGGFPVRPAWNPTRPRSVRDGIAYMGRRNNNRRSGGNSGGNSGGGRRWGARDGTGKFHGDIPQSTRGMSAAEKEKLKRDLEGSVRKREAEQNRLGYEAGHEERLSREKSALRRLFGK